MDLVFNDKQSVLSDDYLKTLPKEIVDELYDAINNIPFIHAMVDAKRGYAKDRPRDDEGRIIVDLTHPHILEDMDYFRPAALHFKKYGCYTLLRPNSNPNSEFMKWLREEIHRMWYGMVRESDGEWIPGDLYFYWNYSPILQTKLKKGSKKGNRVEDFPEPWDSTYLWSHYIYQAIYGGKYNDYLGGQHFGVIARRGIGKSLFIASMLAKQFIVGENAEVNKSVKNTVVASDKTFLIEDGTLNKFEDMIDFVADHMELPAKRIKSSLADMYWEMGYYDGDNQQIKRGTGNVVVGLSVKDKAGKIRGKRSVRTYFEEFGMFPNFIETYNTALYNAEEGGVSFGSLGFIGTGGSKASDFSGALEIIYHPEAYNVYPLPNVFDKKAQGKSNTIMFLGAYLNRKLYYDENGNSDVVGALIEILLERLKIKQTASDPTSVTQKKAEMPITIQDCIMKVGTNIYPVADLNDRLMELSSNPHLLDDVYIGKLNLVGGKVEFQSVIDQPIRDFPHKTNKLEGAIEIFKMPEKNKTTGEVFKGRYIAGADVYDNDVADSLSLGSILVLDTFTDQIVCEYTGRPMFADDFYEICRRICLFYNCQLCYENNKKGLYGYFSRTHSTYLLKERLQFLRDTDLAKGESFGNTAYGVTSTVPIKKYASGRIRDWLLKPCTKIVDEQEITYPHLFDLKNVALLKELSLYNLDGNFDRHDALAMLILYREDIYRLTEGTPQNRQQEPDGLERDKFFDRYDQLLAKRNKKYN